MLALPVSFVGTGARYMKVMFWSSLLALILPTFGEISRSVFDGLHTHNNNVDFFVINACPNFSFINY